MPPPTDEPQEPIVAPDYLGELSPRIVELVQAVKEVVPLHKEGTQILHVGNVVLNINVNIVNTNSGDNKSINTGGGAFTANAPVTTGDDNTITSTTTIGAATPLNEELERLTKLVDELVKQLPPKEAKNAQKCLKELKEQAAEAEPNKAWYEVSADGLKEAAKAVVSIGPDVVKSVTTILKLLSGAPA